MQNFGAWFILYAGKFLETGPDAPVPPFTIIKGEIYMQTYLKNGYIVTMGADETVYDGGGVLIEGENIVAVGKIDP